MLRDTQQENMLYGFYRGVVLKHLSNGKCKIWIPAVYPDELKSEASADDLPSAEQASSIEFGANTGNGVFSYPNIGAVVWCFFEGGDQNKPVYFASTLGGPEAKAEWDQARIMAGKEKEDAYVHHVQVKNTHVYLYESGMVIINTHDSSGAKTCTFTMDAAGNVNINSTDTISLNAKNISINGSTQVDIIAPNIKDVASVQYYIKSPAIQLDSSAGKTEIKSRALYALQNPAITTF